jgi:hypothetical protein
MPQKIREECRIIRISETIIQHLCRRWSMAFRERFALSLALISSGWLAMQ